MGKTRTSKTVHSIQCKIFGFTGPLLTFYLLFILKWCCGAKTGPIVVVFTTVIPKNLLHYSNRKKSSGLKWFPPKRRCTDDVLYGTSLIKWKILLKLFYLFYSFYFCMKWYSQTNWIKTNILTVFKIVSVHNIDEIKRCFCLLFLTMQVKLQSSSSFLRFGTHLPRTP